MGIPVHTAAEIGALIRERRKELGLDQQVLARRVGVSRQWIVAIEKGKPRAEVGLVLRTLRALDLILRVDMGTPAATAESVVTGSDIDALIDRARGGR